VVVPTTLDVSLAAGEAVLRFPYDERLRQLLRTIPGRRWDPEERVWRLPLEPEPAAALARLLSTLRCELRVQEDLVRALRRACSRRRHGDLPLELARPDGRWWLSFPLDTAPELAAELLGHPDGYDVAALGRGLIPIDERSLGLLRELHQRGGRLRVSAAVRRALRELEEPRSCPEGDELADDDHSRRPIREWLGTIDVASRDVERDGEPVFLLLGDSARLPQAVRDCATGAPGGVTVPLTPESWALMDGELRGWVTPAARRCIAALREGRPAPPAVLELAAGREGPSFVLAPGHDPAQQLAFAALPGALPGRRGGMPEICADPFCVPQLDRFLADSGVWVHPRALALLQEVREQHALAAGLVALSEATDAPLRVPGLAGELKPFQRAGVSYLLAQRRAFLADEQGLGKTIEALAALEADGAYPAVVVCPASLKLNWLREIERWLPARGVRTLSGTGEAAVEVREPHIALVNYDILAARLAELRALGPRALVLDESHYCKNAAAKRTQAVAQLAAAVPPDGLLLALTGTPVMNRPPELIAQLRILGRLHDFGSGAQFGRRFRGPDAHLRLHWHLRARCFVRRRKADVLPQLPPKTRAVVPIELDNEPEYRLAERDLVAWLRSQPLDLRELDARVAAALRAERLVRLNALKLLAARGKLRAALAWIHNFLATGERLVVFARHREIQRAVVERFPAALHILGDDAPGARDRALRAFQAPEGTDDNQLIVCSIEVAGQGLTLTRASNVAFLELDWTPAKHDQAEDRCHRIGQPHAVNIAYLLAADTVDETIATLLERKRSVIDAVTDGRHEDEEAVLDALVRELRGAPYRHLRVAA